MNITFLIGNGFDINLGLKTQFCDFLEEYKKPCLGDSEIKTYFKQVVLQDEALWSNAELAFGESTALFMEQGFTDADFSECHTDFCNKLGKYLEKQESRINFSQTDVYDVFGATILGITKGLNVGAAEKIRNMINSPKEQVVFNFITFNYTRVIDKFFTTMKAPNIFLSSSNSKKTYKGRMVHLHGYTNTDMMLGVNDESQIKAPQLFKDKYFKIQLIKPIFNQMNGSSVDDISLKLINNSDVIYIYGMSLGDTDAVWWKNVALAMGKNTSMDVIIYVHKKFGDDVVPLQKVRTTDMVKDRFLSFSGISPIVLDSLKRRTYVVFDNIFEPVGQMISKRII